MVNQMSDDLISRKAAYKAFSDYLNRNYIGEISSQTELNIGEIASVIKSVPTAFNKGKVIEEIRNVPHGYYNAETENEIIEIVEKGGIE